MLKVLMVSTFGPNTRGISPYADKLVEHISYNKNTKVKLVDYKKPFPSFLLPPSTNYDPDNSFATISYTNPFTWNLLKNNQFDIIHIQYWSPAFLPIILAVLLRSRNNSTKIIITWHNASPHEKLPLLKALEKLLTKFCDCIVCHTKKGKHLLGELNSKVRIEVIPHGCDVHNITPPNSSDYEKCSLSKNYEYLLFFGNIRPYKGLDILLNAWNEVSQNHPQTKLIVAGRIWEESKSLISKIINKIAGTSSYSKKIRTEINKSSDNIICDLNFIPNEKLISYLKIAKLAIFPYRKFESQSGAAALAASYGLPFVTSSEGGLTQLAIDDTFIIKNLSAQSLAECINDVLTNFDNNLKSMQLHKAKENIWSKCADLHTRVYKDILNYQD